MIINNMLAMPQLYCRFHVHTFPFSAPWAVWNNPWKHVDCRLLQLHLIHPAAQERVQEDTNSHTQPAHQKKKNTKREFMKKEAEEGEEEEEE